MRKSPGIIDTPKRRPLAFDFEPKRTEGAIRTTCGDRHWWWPSPTEGDRCLCGAAEWVSASDDATA